MLLSAGIFRLFCCYENLVNIRMGLPQISFCGSPVTSGYLLDIFDVPQNHGVVTGLESVLG